MRKYGLMIMVVLAGIVAFWLYRKYRVAPDVDLVQLPIENLDGSPFDKSRLNGKTLFVHYWATWCPECLQEMPSIAAACAQTDDVVFLMVSDETPDKISRYLSQHDYPMTFVRTGKRFQEMDIYTIPTTVLYNAAGTEMYSRVGGAAWDEPAMLGILKNASGN